VGVAVSACAYDTASPGVRGPASYRRRARPIPAGPPDAPGPGCIAWAIRTWPNLEQNRWPRCLVSASSRPRVLRGLAVAIGPAVFGAKPCLGNDLEQLGLPYRHVIGNPWSRLSILAYRSDSVHLSSANRHISDVGPFLRGAVGHRLIALACGWIAWCSRLRSRTRRTGVPRPVLRRSEPASNWA